MRTEGAIPTLVVTRHQRRPSPRRRGGALGALLMALLLVGSVAAAQPGLTVWSYAPSFVAQRWLQEQANAYALATGTTVTVRTLVFDDLRGRLMVSADDGPDLVVTIPHDWLPGLIEAGVVLSLDGLVDDETLRGVAPIALEAFSSGGALFGLPVEITGVALIHDRAQVEQVPSDWEAFVDLARSYTSDGRFGFLYPYTDPFFSYGWWHAYGGYVFASSGAGGWDDHDLGLGGEPGYAAARVLRDLRHGYGLLPASSDYGRMDGEFMARRTPMIINGTWALGDYLQAGIDLGIAPVPTPPDAVRPWAPLVGVQGIVIGASAADPAAAMGFALHLAGPEGAQAYRDAGGARIPVSDLAALEGDDVTAAFAAVLAAGELMPATMALDDVWAPWASAIRRATQAGDADLVSIIDDLEGQLQR